MLSKIKGHILLIQRELHIRFLSRLKRSTSVCGNVLGMKNYEPIESISFLKFSRIPSGLGRRPSLRSF
jgi:hypothetical protein